MLRVPQRKTTWTEREQQLCDLLDTLDWQKQLEWKAKQVTTYRDGEYVRSLSGTLRTGLYSYGIVTGRTKTRVLMSTIGGCEFVVSPHPQACLERISREEYLAAQEGQFLKMSDGRTKIEDPIEKRVAMINGYFPLPTETTTGMKEVREAVSECATKLESVFKRCKVDTGRAIATIDLLQQAKNVGCDALILPHAEK
jgi:hypothetical protein